MLGANLGAWRSRAEWQASKKDFNQQNEQNSQFTSFYAYRAIRKLSAKLTIGESYINSDLFDMLKFVGASLISDDKMLPPNLRGYAPQVNGIAKSNATVTITQQGRVVYESQVPSGPFTISDLSDALAGELDVKVQEQDGTVQNFKVNTATIPYLTRPGSFRFKLFSGRPTNDKHQVEGDVFAAAEGSWGVSNGWSLYGGALTSVNYNSVAIGFGRDLLAFGAIALDITMSNAKLPDSTKRGKSYRVSYSKLFDEIGTQFTFAGYRFSEENYMTYDQFNNYMKGNGPLRQSKEMYTATINQQLRSLGLSAYLNYTHESYWDNTVEERYDISLSHYMDLGKFKNASLTLSAYKSKYEGINDKGIYASIAIPFGESATVSTGASYTNDKVGYSLGYSERLKNGDSYNINANSSDYDTSMSGYYHHVGDIAEINTNASYSGSNTSSLGINVRGGVTATAKGAALHRSNSFGG
ncbi:TPA: fimbria/pilus outer membrane usher protein, partial [Enterobacter asburiae]|nr:fimbria/pilus outer membrane usher protein [Enterobacter asburiae]